MKKIEQDIKAYSKENIYDLDTSIMIPKYVGRIIDIMKEERGTLSGIKTLELGLGQGYSTPKFEEEFLNHTVLDGDKDIIQKYRNEHPSSNVHLVETYFEDFEPEEKYDLIIMGFVLEHVLDPVALIAQYRKYLTSDGRIFITVPNATSLHRRVGNVAGMLQDMYELSETDIGYGHRRYYDLEKLKNDCIDAGLKIIRTEGLFLKPITTGQMLQLNLSNTILEAFYDVGINYPELCAGIMIEGTNNE